MYPLKKSNSFLKKSGPSYDRERKHLHVVLTNPCPKDKVLIVPISSWKENHRCDDTCILEPHEHDFLKHKSYAVYRECRIEVRTAIEKAIINGLIISKSSVNAQVLNKLRAGVLKSESTPIPIGRYFSSVKNTH